VISNRTRRKCRKEGRDGRCISEQGGLFLKTLESKQKILNKDIDDFFLFKGKDSDDY